ncbi:hypothetical protein CGRA01v4_11667 [Colletotrichum graminicola]|nr:hypothetical protein CGRA01v4_11667 [Colletotrichum graminicola]
MLRFIHEAAGWSIKKKPETYSAKRGRGDEGWIGGVMIRSKRFDWPGEVSWLFYRWVFVLRVSTTSPRRMILYGMEWHRGGEVSLARFSEPPSVVSSESDDCRISARAPPLSVAHPGPLFAAPSTTLPFAP